TYDTSKISYYPCPLTIKNSKPSLNYCLQSQQTPAIAAVFGDSHADHIFHGIAKVDTSHSWLLVGNSSCEPVSGINIGGVDVDHCKERVENIIHYLKTAPTIKLVVISYFGNMFKDTNFAADHLKKLGLIRRLKITGEKN